MIEEVIAQRVIKDAMRPVIEAIEKHEKEFHGGTPCESTREYVTMECGRMINADPYVIRDKMMGILGTGPRPTGRKDVQSVVEKLLDTIFGGKPDVKPAPEPVRHRPLAVGDRVICNDPHPRAKLIRGLIGTIRELNAAPYIPGFEPGHMVAFQVTMPEEVNAALKKVIGGNPHVATDCLCQVPPQFLEHAPTDAPRTSGHAQRD